MSDDEPRATVGSALSTRALRRLSTPIKSAVLALIIPVLLVSALRWPLEFAQILNDPHAAANKDFVSYWAAGKLLVSHRNPYDARAARTLEKAAGYLPSQGLTMRNPPVALFLVVPLGLLGIKWAVFLWTLLIAACVAVAVRVVWTMHARPPNKIHMLGFVFPAAISCLAAGQTSAFALVGLTLFLCLNKRRPFLAGVSIAVCAIKPHLFLPFGAVLLMWIIINRLWPVILGAVTALVASLAIVMSFHGPVWSEYFAMLTTDGVGRDLIAVTSSLLRFAINRNEMWLQFVPAMLGILWAVWYFRRHRTGWDWQTMGSLLLLVSLFVAPYSWFFDEIILIPAILHGIYASSNQLRAGLGFGVISCVATVEGLAGVPLYSGLYMWTSALWLGWYVLETRQSAPVPEANMHMLLDPGTRGDMAAQMPQLVQQDNNALALKRKRT
ncbi:MAG: DUF2029 domain-containing protein [Acidobacteriaceae bacterium]|nr:DUF2029 domain-containing protein [Acidobacteriaceae bacterium]